MVGVRRTERCLKDVSENFFCRKMAVLYNKLHLLLLKSVPVHWL